MRTLPLCALLVVASCTSAPRAVIVVSPGTELVCSARSVATAAPSVVALDASTASADVPPVDAAVEPVDAPATPLQRRSLAVDPAHAALLPASERTLTVVRVARCVGARALVVLHDGRVEAWPLASLRAARLAPNVEVMAYWQGGESAYHAVVTAVSGDAVHLRYDDESVETLEAARLESVRVASVPPAATGLCAATGTTLPLALVERERWRRAAAVVECGGPSALVDTLRDGRQTVPLEGLARLTLTRGDRVMVRWRDDHDWPATVGSVDGASVGVTYEDGSEETVALGQIVAWSAMGASTPAPYRCP